MTTLPPHLRPRPTAAVAPELSASHPALASRLLSAVDAAIDRLPSPRAETLAAALFAGDLAALRVAGDAPEVAATAAALDYAVALARAVALGQAAMAAGDVPACQAARLAASQIAAAAAEAAEARAAELARVAMAATAAADIPDLDAARLAAHEAAAATYSAAFHAAICDCSLGDDSWAIAGAGARAAAEAATTAAEAAYADALNRLDLPR